MTAQQIDESRVRKALSTVIEPELHQDLITLNFIHDISITDNDVGFTIMLTTPAWPLKDVLRQENEQALRRDCPGVSPIGAEPGRSTQRAPVRTDRANAHSLTRGLIHRWTGILPGPSRLRGTILKTFPYI